MKNNWRDYWTFTQFLWRRFNEVRVLQVAGSLTFTTLLALVPILMVILVLMSAFPIFGDVSNYVMEWVNEMIVPHGALQISSYLTQFQEQASKLTTVGLLMMLLTSLLLIQTIDQTFNRIWRVKKPRSAWFQFPVYWALLTFMPMILGLSSSIATQLENTMPLFSGSLKMLWRLTLDILGAYILYRVVPNRYVPITHALIGAIFTTFLMECTKWGFGIYIKNFNNYQLVYGAFAAIPVFLIWLHLLWTIILSGAVLTAGLSYWHGKAYQRPKGRRALFNDIVLILLMLKRAQTQGVTLHVWEIKPYVNMGYDELGDLLDTLEEYGYIGAHKNGWLLKKSCESILLSELVSQFVYTPSQIDNAIKDALEELMLPSFEVLAMSLAEFELKFGLAQRETFCIGENVV